MIYMNDFRFYTLIDHTADLGILIKDQDLKGLFKKAALALIHIMIGEIPKGQTSISELYIKGEDMIDLMLNWLSEILYLFEGEKKILKEEKMLILRVVTRIQ